MGKKFWREKKGISEDCRMNLIKIQYMHVNHCKKKKSVFFLKKSSSNSVAEKKPDRKRPGLKRHFSKGGTQMTK